MNALTGNAPRIIILDGKAYIQRKRPIKPRRVYYADNSKTYQPNGKRECARRQRRMKCPNQDQQ